MYIEEEYDPVAYTFKDAEVVVDDLGERGEAVGGAGGVGHHLVTLVVLLVVHTLHTDIKFRKNCGWLRYLCD